ASSLPVRSPEKCNVFSASCKMRSRLSPDSSRVVGAIGKLACAGAAVSMLCMASGCGLLAAGPGADARCVRARFGGRQGRACLYRGFEPIGGAVILAVRQIHDAEVVVGRGRIAGRKELLFRSFEVAGGGEGEREVVVRGREIRLEFQRRSTVRT